MARLTEPGPLNEDGVSVSVGPCGALDADSDTAWAASVSLTVTVADLVVPALAEPEVGLTVTDTPWAGAAPHTRSASTPLPSLNWASCGVGPVKPAALQVADAALDVPAPAIQVGDCVIGYPAVNAAAHAVV